MQRVFELISSVNSIVNNVKATAKKVCRNIIITMATAISILTVIIVSVIINGEQKSYAEEATAVADKTIEATSEEMQVAEEDVTEATTEEATTELRVEATTESVTEEPTTAEPVTEATTVIVEAETKEETTTVYLSNAEVELKEYVTSTYAPVEIYYTEADYDALLKIVHAEAGNQDDIGKILVANVIINRVKSKSFPNDIYSVITQNDGKTYQFSPVIPGGSYYWIEASEHTKQCVDRALAGEDYSNGALYFCRETSSNSWFNTRLTFLFTHGPHYFYK